MRQFNAYVVRKDGIEKYVGVTTRSISKRWKEHLLKGNGCHRLANAIKKYGANPFSIELVAQATSESDLSELEKLLIIQYGTLSKNGGYNLNSGGRQGFTWSEEVKAKISAAHQGKVGHLSTPESRAKISAAHKGRKLAPGHLANVVKANKSRPHSPEESAQLVIRNKLRGYEHRNPLSQGKLFGELPIFAGVVDDISKVEPRFLMLNMPAIALAIRQGMRESPSLRIVNKPKATIR